MQQYKFIEVGTSDFDTMAQSCDYNDFGISIEPLKLYLDRLPVKPNLTKINCAVLDTNSTEKFFYMDPSLIKSLNLPGWARGNSCLEHTHPNPELEQILRAKGLSPEDVFTEIAVEVKPLSDIYIEYEVGVVDILKIDTEGFDCRILKKFHHDISQLQLRYPNKIIFESNILSNREDVNDIIRLYRSAGYNITKTGHDTHMQYA